jgi:hypothetical protein
MIFPASHHASVAQSTNIAVGTTVQRSQVKRLGVNLGGQNFYDSGQMMRNLIFRNPGFEGETFQNILHCVTVTATSCTDANPWNIWTLNFLQGASYEVVNGAAEGETGTVTSSSISAYEAGNSTNPNYGVTITFAAPSKPLVVGDWVIVRTLVPGNAQDGWWTGTSSGATIATDFTDIAPDSPGKQALELKALSSGQSAHVSAYFDSVGSQSFVQMNGSYTVSFKAKGLGGNNQLAIALTRLGAENLLNKTVTLTGQWQDYNLTFNASETGKSLGTVQLSFSIAGADIYIDDTTLTEAAAANNPTAYRNAVVATLRTLQPGVIRYMTGSDWGSSIDNVIAVPFARQRAAFSNPEQDDEPMGLEEFLVLCQTVGAEPWYTMAGGASTTDMQNLIEFLGGAASTPYGAKRAALGQTAPWTSVFPVIHIELGNEMWNGQGGATINDPVVYGQRAAKIFAAARSSASYVPAKFDLIMGSWAVNSWWTQQELANSSGYDSVDAAPYLFYSLSDYSSNEAIFGPMFAQPEQIDSTTNGYMAQQHQQANSANTPANLAVYEVNLSTVSGTAPQNVVNQVVGGVGAGITVADHMLLMMRDLGITTQNMFALTEYGNGFNNPNISGETTPLWGSVIDMGGETNVQRPQFLAEQLVNSAIFPTMLTTTLTGANPTWNQPLSANDNLTPIELADAHYLQSFAFTDGTQKSVIVFNLSRSGSLPVTFSGANAPTGDVLISQLTSANITDNNEGLTSDKPVVIPTYANVSNFSPAAPYSLPPYSMTVFLWSGSAAPTVPQISSVSANYGAYYAITMLAGTNFGATQGASTVTFNGAAAPVTAWSNSSITVTVPYHATTGNLVVTVGDQPSNGIPFTVEPTASITGMNPTIGPVGTLVTISGQNLLDAEGHGTVWLSGISLPILNPTNTGIQVKIPAGAVTGTIDVHTNGVGRYTSTFTVAPPQISSVSANYGAYYAITMLAGTNFGATQGASTVTFNGAAAPVTAWSNSSITVTVPYHATTGNLVVTVGDQPSNGIPFTVEPTASITGMNPTIGPVGTLVTISGQNLLDAEGHGTVWLSGISLPILNPTNTGIQVKIPAGAVTGTIDIHTNGVGNYTSVFTVN